MEDIINKHQCLSCCLKHLASALVISGEIKTGYDLPEYHLYLLGNLAEAQEQVAITRPKLANQIRNLRLDIFGDGGVAYITESLQLRIMTIVKNLRTAIASAPTTPVVPRNKNCNCQKKTAKALPSKGAKKSTS